MVDFPASHVSFPEGNWEPILQVTAVIFVTVTNESCHVVLLGKYLSSSKFFLLDIRGKTNMAGNFYHFCLCQKWIGSLGKTTAPRLESDEKK